MKVAIYIEDGLEQIVLTPQSDLEKSALEKMASGRSMRIHKGGFYECRGGWVRQQDGPSQNSTIIVLREVTEAVAEEG